VYRLAWLLSLGVGFLSLSQEILWVRIVGFAYSGAPHGFAFTLAHFLVGIAAGAMVGKRVCDRSTDLRRSACWALVVAAGIDLALPLLASTVLTAYETQYPLSLATAIVVSAGAKSVLFPIAHQLGSTATGPRVGRSVSRIYFANIIGSTLGPLITGYVLLDLLSVDKLMIMGGLCLLLLAAMVASPVAGKPWLRLGTLSAAAVIAVPLWRLPDAVLQSLAEVGVGEKLLYVISTRAGVLHAHTGPHGDVVYGGNVYDGRASVDVDHNANRLDRLYLLGLVHPRPKRALVVGLSTGAWTRALLDFPDIERIDVVEINPGYLAAISRYPDINAVLKDPRVLLHIDDGRRWLHRHPEARFDLIVQNTTFHWRANASSLLSIEYMREVLDHLEEQGVMTLNTTGSFDVLKTAGEAFPYAYRYANLVYGARHALVLDPARLQRLRRPDGRYFSLAEPDGPESVVAKLRDPQLEPTAEALLRAKGEVGVITDDNLLVEYRHGRRLGPPWFTGMLPRVPSKFTINHP